MVAVITGKSYGLEQGSGFVLGSRGQWGQSAIGRANDNVFVNAATGNLVITNTDEMLIGLGLDAVTSRTYNSLGGWDGDNGDQWRAGYYRRVTGLTGTVNTSGSTITRTDWDGSESVYAWDSTRSAYVSTDGAGAYDTLTYASNVWTWKDGDSRVTESYDATNGGRITSSADTDGNTLSYTYTSGLLTKVTTADGQDTTLSYNGSSQLTQLVTHHGTGTLSTFTRINYEYDTSGRLKKVIVDLSPTDNSVSDGNTYWTEYTYDGTSNRIASITQKDQSSLTITYDGSNRVSTLTQAIASGVSRVTTIGYGTNTATITDASGQVTTLNYDSEKRLTSIVAPPPVSGGSSQTTSFAYNSRGDVVSVTDPTTKAVVYDATPLNLSDADGYDANGNRTYEKDSAGNTIRRTFGTNNELLTETRYTVADAGSGASGAMTSRYAYDSENHLRYVVSAEGYVTEFIYGTTGLQTSAIQYAGHVYSLSGLSPSDPISESTLSSWVSGLTDKSTAKRVDTTYNYRGQIDTVTSFGKTTTAGAGDTTATTEITKLIYVYDQAGNLKSRQLNGSTSEVFTYDGLNRVISSSDYNGLTTNIVFTDNLTKTAITIGEVMTRTSTYNWAGELISVVESASGTTTDTKTYRYDTMGRLRGVTEQTGVKSFYLYDRVGRLVAEVDGTGALTEFAYDADGLLIRTIKYKTLVSSTLLTQLDSNTLNYTYELSAYRPSADAADIWEWRLYDDAQRLVETIDGVGAVTTFTYDGASRLVGTTQHGNRFDATTIAGFKTTPPTLTTGKPPRTATPSTAPSGYTTTAGGTSGANTMTGTTGSDFIDGQGGNDTLSGGNGADILIGNTGNDGLTGGTGADIFVFRPGDGADTIADFNRSQLDLIDLSAYTAYSSLAQLSVVQSGAATVITLSDGVTITLTSFTASTLTDADFVFADRTARQFYDDDGRLEATLDAEGYLTRFLYDSAGQLVQTWAYATATPLAYRTGTLATILSNTSASSATDIHSWTIYDQRGLVRATINGEGDVVRYHYTALGHLDQEIRGQKLSSSELTSQLSTPYTLATLPSAGGGTVLETKAWRRDNYGRLLTETRTLASGTETDIYLYDSFGKLMSVTTASGTGQARTTLYQYDNQGRLTGQVSGEGAAVLGAYANWTYDGSPIVGTASADNPLTGTAGRDLIQGLAGADTINGGAGDDRIEGGADADVVNGGDGNDIIFAGAGTDASISGGAGRDIFVVVSGDGADTVLDFQLGIDLIDLRAFGGYVTIAASGTTDTLLTLAGGGTLKIKNLLYTQFTAADFLVDGYDQVLVGTSSNDTTGLGGGAGKDLILGLNGNDTMTGGAGNDRIDGGLGAETIDGGAGDDIILAGTSTDATLYGGTGRDVFVMLPGDGADTILDFEIGVDLLDLTSFGGTAPTITQSGADALVTTSNGSFRLKNRTATLVTSNSLLLTAADVFRAYGTTYAYDEADRLISKTESDGTVTGGNKTLYYYDKAGRLTHTINALGEVSEYRYDSFGRQTNVVTYGTRLSSLSGLVGGLMTTGLASSLSSLANAGVDSVVTTTYDVASRVTNVSTAGGKSTDYAYGAFDEAVTQRDKLTAAPTYRTAVMTYDRRGLMASTTADFGGLNLTTLASYDAFGRAINTTDADGKVRQTGYDRAGRVLTTTDPLGGVTTYEYDGRGAVVTIKDRTWTSLVDNKTTFTYTAFNRQVVMTTAQGLVTTTVNNAYGQTVSITDGASRKVSYSYDRDGRLQTTVVDEGSGTLNLTTENHYDKAGRLSWVLDAAGSKTSFTYDAANRVLTRKVDDGGLGLVTTYAYDAKGQQTTVTDAAGRVTQVAFDLDGQTTMVTADPADLKISTKYEYDLAGRTLKVSQGSGTTSFTATKVTDYVYDNADRLTETHVDQSGLNLTTKYKYDKRGNVVVKIEVIGGAKPDAITRYVYDADNRLIWTVDATGAVTNTAYDAEGRITSTRGYVNKVAAGTMTTWASNPVTATDVTSAVSTTASDHQSTFVYDYDGRLRYTIDGLNRVVELVYDNSGNVTQKTVYATAITPPGTLTVANVAAAITTNANDRTTKAVFDAAGRQTHSIDAVGAVTAFEYDGTGKVTVATQFSALYSSGTFSTWLSSHAADADNRVTRTFYDGAGRAMIAVDAENYITQIKYDGSNNAVKSIRYSSGLTGGTTLSNIQSWMTTHASDSGNVVERTLYDLAGRATYAVDGETYVTKFTYDALGNVTDQTRLAAKYTVSDSDTDATLTTAIGTIPSSAVITHMTYDAAGRMTSQTRGYGDVDPSTTSYAYDGASRMVSMTNGLGYATLYDYDGAGHLITKTVPLASGANAITQYEYDAFGNQVKITDPRGFVGYSYYDKLGRMTLQVDPGGYATATEYSLGNEVTKVIRYLVQSTNSYSTTVLPTLSTNAAEMAETVMVRDKLDRVTDVIDAMGKAERYDLNAFGDRVKVWNRLTTSRSDVFTENTYDRRGLLTHEKLPITASIIGGGTVTGVINTFTYDSRGNRLTAVEGDNRNGSNVIQLAERRTTTFEYDKLDRLTKEIGDLVATVTDTLVAGTSVNPTQTIAYDSFGNIRESIDANGYRTLYWYDELGRKTDQLSPAGTLTHWTYDDADNAITVKVYGDVKITTDPWSTATPTPVNSSNYRLTTNTYDYNNRLKTTSVSGLRTGEYNGASFSTSSGVTVTTQKVYNALGGVTQEIDGRGNVIYQLFDKNGRVIARIDQENFLTTFVVDSEGNVTTETRYATRLTASASTLAGLTTSVTSLSDTALTSLIAASPTTDRTTHFTYDENGRRLTETRLNVVAYDIDETPGVSDSDGVIDGDLYVRTGSYGDATIRYEYDGLGNVTKKVEANGDTSDFVYDAIGRMTRQQGASFTAWLTSSTTGTVRNTTDYTYDAIGNVVSTREGKATADGSNDRITTYIYGAGGRLMSMTDAAGFQRTFGYDAAGHVVKEEYTRYNGSSSTALIEANLYVYDAMGRVIQQATASKPSGTWVFGDRTHVGYNVFGEVVGKGTTAGSVTTATYQETFEYDAAGRMWKSNTGDGSTRLYIHDGNGAVTLTVSSTGTDFSSYTTIETALTALGATNATGGAYLAGIAPTITVYDKRGQATSTREHFREVDDSGTETIVRSRAYNAFGEVKSETDARGNAAGSGFTIDYSYNTMGRLIQKQSPFVSVTAENGAVSTTRPTENYYYDISGRLIGVEDANSNLNKRALLAGSGHGDDEAIVTAEFRAGGTDTTSSGIYRTLTDVFGNLKVLTNEVGAVEKRDYDLMGRLTKITRPTRTSTSTTLEENYVYDGLGNRTQHWNNQFGSTVIEMTDYDAQGRVIKTYDYGGNYTTYSYSWNASLVTTGLGTFGGWEKTTILPATVSSVEKTDYFGRSVARTDFGGTVYTMTFDKGGRLIGQNNTAGQDIDYAWYNTGKLASILDDGIPNGSDLYGGMWQVTNKSVYTYDVDGNKLTESQILHRWGAYFEPSDPQGGGGPDPIDPGIPEGEYVEFDVTTTNKVTAGAWDAMNRLLTIWDYVPGATVDINVDYAYDAVGNLRHVESDFRDPVTNSYTAQSYWYKYDSMNRFTTTMGTFTGTAGSGTISRGTTGTDITYDAAGNRASATSASSAETYAYSADGFLETVHLSGVLKVTEVRDAMGRVTSHTELNSAGQAAYVRIAYYDNLSQVTSESTTTRLASTIRYNTTYNDYLAESSPGSGVYSGAYLGGVVTHSTTSGYTTNLSGGSYTSLPTSETKNTYGWTDSAKQTYITYKPNASSGTTYTSQFIYDQNFRISKVRIQDGAPRTVYYASDANGQITYRNESPDSAPGGGVKVNYLYFDGIRFGETSNDGDPETDYTVTINRRSYVPTNLFRYGSATSYADFDQSYNPINANNPGQSGSSYIVADGDTLQGIAQAVWGDASLWYLIAQANGLSSSDTLVGGMMLTLPSAVANVHNNDDTFRPYDPNKALGNTSPTQPKPAPKGNKGCGTLGMIIMIVVAVVVSVVTFGAATTAFAAMGPFWAAVAAGAVAGVASSIASQVVGLALGVVDEFSWTDVAIAAISGAVGGAVGTIGPLQTVNEAGQMAANFARGVVRGAISNAITQHIAVSVGLQDKFDWTGVAVAAISTGVGSAVGGALPNAGAAPYTADGIRNGFIESAAGGIAGAATRSLIEGSDFGDNLRATLPEIIGTTIGNAIGGAINRAIEVERFNAAVDRQVDRLISDGRFSEKRYSEEGNTELRGIAQTLTISEKSLGLKEGYILSNLDDEGVAASKNLQFLKRPVADPLDSPSKGEMSDALYAVLDAHKRATSNAPVESRLTDDRIDAITRPFVTRGLLYARGTNYWDTVTYGGPEVVITGYKINNFYSTGFNERYDEANLPKPVLGSAWADATLISAGHALKEVGTFMQRNPWMGIALDVFSAVTSPVTFIVTKAVEAAVGAVAGDKIEDSIGRVAQGIASPFLRNGYSAESAQYAALATIGILGAATLAAGTAIATALIKTAVRALPKIISKVEAGLERLGLRPKVSLLASQFATKPDTAFFWSGRTEGIGGEKIAGGIASARGGTTLEMLLEDRGIKLPPWDAGNPSVVAAWENASAEYARNASGTVRAVIGAEMRPGNVWQTQELPALLSNPKVTKIIVIDPKTLKETLIFKRSKY